MKQGRYTHSAIFYEGWVYVLGGRYFGEDEQAILRNCERINVEKWINTLNEE